MKSKVHSTKYNQTQVRSTKFLAVQSSIVHRLRAAATPVATKLNLYCNAIPNMMNFFQSSIKAFANQFFVHKVIPVASNGNCIVLQCSADLLMACVSELNACHLAFTSSVCFNSHVTKSPLPSVPSNDANEKVAPADMNTMSEPL